MKGDSRHGSSFSRFLRRLSIILFWIVLWQTAASLIRNHIFLVGPVDTLRALCEQILLPDFWSAIAFSFWRISIGFFLAFFLDFSPVLWRTVSHRGRILRAAGAAHEDGSRRFLRDPGADLDRL